ncbi:MAG TPA: hypothetical protein VK970_08575 [Candidatus Methylacidiphilales bacterium]|nr:hypothetical protein [Candidatus Methylacidiphilales bacterium]
MALVLTLAIVALLTIAVLAFFSRVTSTRLIEASRIHRVRSNILAQSAADYTASMLLQEIGDPANSTVLMSGDVPLYVPVSGTRSVPRRQMAGGISVTDAKFFNLIRQSVPSADANASDDSTTLVSRNSRSIRMERWNLPVLLGGNGFSNADELPNWIYIDAAGATKTRSAKVFGRFAFNVYDIGGLLDINTAGYPSSLSAGDISRIKGLQAGADLTQLSLAQTNIDKLLSFRNPGSAVNAATFKDSVTTLAQSGYLAPTATSLATSEVFTNNVFIGRQDLLRYAQTQNPAIAGGLAYLTHYSRSVNAPSWSPQYNAATFGSTNLAAAYKYRDNADITTASPFTVSSPNPNAGVLSIRSQGATIVHYRDDGTAESYNLDANEPAVQRRFSLARLPWLTPTGPAAGISPAAIQSCFGLLWDSSNDRWNYVGHSGTAPQSSIKTLTTVAAEGREPNFFELLKAGILSGSLGLCEEATSLTNPMYRGTPAAPGLERNADLHVLRIGANIIDCADTDNYPTVIAVAVNSLALEVAGVEDLPYFHSMWMNLFQKWDSTTAPTRYTKADLIWIPILFNPHRASVSTAGPSLVTMDFADGVLTRITDNNNGLGQNMTKSFAAMDTITVPAVRFDSFRSGPQPVRDAAAVNTMTNLIPYVTGTYTDALGYRLFSYQNEYTGTWPAVPSTGSHSSSQRCLTYMQNVMPRLQYKSPSGRMKTYGTLSGIEGTSLTTGIHRTSTALYCGGFTAGDDTTITATTSGMRAVLWDPRTSRLGPATSGGATLTDLPPVGTPVTKDRVVTEAPFVWNNNKDTFPIYTGLWPQGGKNVHSAGNYTNLKDPDGIFRPADGWLGNAANPLRPTGATLDITSNARPVILQRPYQSVGELGYVFRDVPWKTLSFFDERSADCALLDFFSVVDEPAIVAGKVRLDTRQPLVQKALIASIGRAADGTDPVSTGIASAVPAAWQSYIYSGGAPTADMPVNVAQLATFLSSPALASAWPASADAVKYRREAIARALAGSSQNRTWNVLIDVVAQSGRFVGGGTSASDFNVDGEQRFWVSLAIDRYTGKIVDEQWEPVNE